MKLNNEGLNNRQEWLDKGYALPQYDRNAVVQATKEAPVWVHFGGGNLFRAYHAALSQTLLNKGVTNKGVIVVEGFDYEIVEKSYRTNDNLSVLVTLKSDGTIEKTLIGSITESCILDFENKTEYDRLKEIFCSDSLQLATFTITEKGYMLKDVKTEEYLPAIAEDFKAGPDHAKSYIGKVASLLYTRYLAGKKPIALLSTDNCSHNGDRLKAAMSAFAEHWCENGTAEPGFVTYVNDPSIVSFPWSMIDKITPRPDACVQEMLKEDGLEGLEPIITSRRSYVAPFVNSEETEYLVVEDNFPNGRPPLEEAGVLFTDRETVDKVEAMKVCTCLNPLHTAMAIYGCLLGYTKISEEMKDPQIVGLIKTIGYTEGLPVVVDPGVLDPKQFINTVVEVRLPNPFMPDAPQRIATDTSQKLAIRYGQTIKKYIESGKNVHDLHMIPLVFAGWLRYLMAIDDNGNAFELSADPLIPTVRPFVENMKLGEDNHVEEALQPVLHNVTIFGIDLYEAGLAETVIDYFKELTSGVGAVRATLVKYVK